MIKRRKNATRPHEVFVPVSADERQLLHRAAFREGRPISNFVRYYALLAAERIMGETSPTDHIGPTETKAPGDAGSDRRAK